MLISNRPGVIGVVLAVALGLWLDSLLPADDLRFEVLPINAGALFLGLYALTVDRCEVPGLLASYRANLQNLFATAAESDLGSYDKAVVPGRRLSFFILPVVVTPVITLLLGIADVALLYSKEGRLDPAGFDRHFAVPAIGVAVWVGYAVLTERLGLRRRLGKGYDPLGMH